MSDTTTPNNGGLGHAAATFLNACGGLTKEVMSRLPDHLVEEVTERMGSGERVGFESGVDFTGHVRICLVAVTRSGERHFLAQVKTELDRPTTVQTLQ
jgi:hypothetical protein